MALETLKSSCSHFNGRRLWLGKAALRSRLVDVRGWRGGRRVRESIPLEEVESVARSNSKTGGNLVFEMKDGSERSLRVSAAGIWRMQIDYRLRRISGQVTADAPGSSKAPPVKVDRSLPTADEVEHTVLLEEGIEPQETDHGSELAVWPRFETEEATIEIVAGTDQEPEFLIEPVAVTEEGLLVVAKDDEELTAKADDDEREEIALVDALSFEIEAEAREDDFETALTEPVIEAVAEIDAVVEPEAVADTTVRAAVDIEADVETGVAPVAETEGVTVPAPEDLHEIGDDVVFDLAMDATTHQDVVMGWLSPVGTGTGVEASHEEEELEQPVAQDDPQADDEAEPDVDAKPLIAEIEVEAPDVFVDAGLEVEAPDVVDAEPAHPLPIAARPFELSRVYDTPEPQEQGEEPVPEPAAVSEPPTEPEPDSSSEPEPDLSGLPEPDFSIEPVAKRERRRRQSMADLRPMSLAELIRESEPRWTRLAEMD